MQCLGLVCRGEFHPVWTGLKELVWACEVGNTQGWLNPPLKYSYSKHLFTSKRKWRGISKYPLEGWRHAFSKGTLMTEIAFQPGYLLLWSSVSVSGFPPQQEMLHFSRLREEPGIASRWWSCSAGQLCTATFSIQMRFLLLVADKEEEGNFSERLKMSLRQLLSRL